ncbi:MAG: SMP-30/gluconolactonase/LRE family protein [Sphingobacteriaceae bacterium]|nr:MAG: SMP-30/gluconolactonase/LRE family protein [Sphingobacteriaceae bacterium]
MIKCFFYHLFFAVFFISNHTFAQKPLTTGEVIYLDPKLEKLISRNARIEVIGSGFQHIEAPVWVPDSSMLLFSDTKAGVIYRWEKGKGTTKFLEHTGFTGRLPYSEEPGSNGLALAKNNLLLICEHGDRRLASFPLNGKYGMRTVSDNFEGRRYNSPNDVIVKSDGTMYITDPPYGLPLKENDPIKEASVNGVYKITADGKSDLIIADLKYPNGIAFSPNETLLYVSVSAKAHPQIMVYPLKKDGKTRKGKIFFDATRLPKQNEEEVTDGLKTDKQGNIWASGPGGILIIDKNGQLLGKISTGEVISNCCWGDDKSTLYITAGAFLYQLKTLAN